MKSIKHLVRPNITALSPYSSARDEFTGGEGVFLDANESPFGTLNRYPDPYQKVLKEQLSKIKQVGANQLFIGNGSDEVIDLLLRICCRPGIDKALTFVPTYGMYEVSAAINDVPLVKVPLNTAFQIDLELLKPYLNDDTLKVIFLCSPNNPTGNCMDSHTIEQILQRFNGIVMVDEAYIDFAKANSLLPLIDEYHNLVVSQTFSKAWGLAGARIGTAYACTEIISLFNKIKPPYNVSSLNQQAALQALDTYAAFKDRVALILAEKERVALALKELTQVQTVYPSDANFLLIEVEDANRLYAYLISKQLIVRNRTAQITNCLRITIGTPEENDKLLNAIKTFV